MCPPLGYGPRAAGLKGAIGGTVTDGSLGRDPDGPRWANSANLAPGGATVTVVSGLSCESLKLALELECGTTLKLNDCNEHGD